MATEVKSFSKNPVVVSIGWPVAEMKRQSRSCRGGMSVSPFAVEFKVSVSGSGLYEFTTP